MKLYQVLLCLISLGVVIWAATSGAHFMRASASVNSSGALVVQFVEAGLGNENVQYLLSADGSGIFGCINGGGNHPKAENKETQALVVVATASAEAKNGKVTATITGPVPTTTQPFCPPGFPTASLFSVVYSDILLKDVSNNVATSLPNASSK